MMRIFGYSLRRLIGNKFFLALAVVTGLYSYQVLSGDIIRGVAYTAPFSGYSYGAYIGRVMPLLMVTVLFFVTFFYGKAEERVRTITDATPMDPRAYRAVRLAAVLVGFVLILLLCVGVSLVFYAQVFGFTGFGAFVGPLLLATVSALLLVLGLALVLGRVHVGLIYAMMLVVMVLGQVGLPGWLDVFGGTFFENAPNAMSWDAGEPAYLVPGGVLAARIAMGLSLIHI